MMEKFISWVEIPASDFHRAVKFYSRVFNLDLKVVEGRDEKMAFFPGGEGAISFAPDFYPSRDGVLVSLNAGKDLNAVLKLVVENGGELLKAKTKIEAEGMGYFALFIDSEGNKIGLYQA
jgi:predicted enzyme related to lactoylglutathione lyase